MASLRGVFAPSYPKEPSRNFIRENVNWIRSRSVSMSRLASTDSRKGPPKRMNPVKTLHDPCNFCQHPPSGKSTDSSSQTIDVNDEFFLKDAIIRFPSSRSIRSTENVNEHSTQTEEEPGRQLSGEFLPHLSLNTQPAQTEEREEMKAPKSSGEKVEQKHRRGEVPKYLIQRKKELEHAAAQLANQTPTGHYLLTEEERLEALHIAQSRYDQLIRELNALSITSQTFRIRTKKIELERELQSLDNTLKIFSRQRVFVNLGE